MDLWEAIKNVFSRATSLTRLIYINLAVFVLVKLVYVVFFLLDIQETEFSLIRWLAVPADPSILVRQPWTLLTYMFLHEGFLHILFNMLWLFWFGRIFLEYLDQKRLTGTYLLGGFAGALLYILFYNLFPVFSETLPRSVALGASAAVYAVVAAISAYVPNHTLNLIFLGPVRIMYIALFVILLDILSIPAGNAGGHIAHLGGALFGLLFAIQYRKGKDITRWFDNILNGLARLFKPRPRIRIHHKKSETDFEFRKRRADEQKEIDRILDKISRGGYECLTAEEKEKLFKASNKG